MYERLVQVCGGLKILPTVAQSFPSFTSLYPPRLLTSFHSFMRSIGFLATDWTLKCRLFDDPPGPSCDHHHFSCRDAKVAEERGSEAREGEPTLGSLGSSICRLLSSPSPDCGVTGADSCAASPPLIALQRDRSSPTAPRSFASLCVTKFSSRPLRSEKRKTKKNEKKFFFLMKNFVDGSGRVEGLWTPPRTSRSRRHPDDGAMDASKGNDTRDWTFINYECCLFWR
mmetsp:Transcript_2182/g.5049  ORF Transcript_2182/g.5049 Transcript_2182/m.5049 type:complete len:227 (-) Transcript_2182:1280-1960(-)